MRLVSFTWLPFRCDKQGTAIAPGTAGNTVAGDHLSDATDPDVERLHVFTGHHCDSALRALGGAGGDQLRGNLAVLDRPVRTMLLELRNAELVRDPQYRPVEVGMVGVEAESQFAALVNTGQNGTISLSELQVVAPAVTGETFNAIDTDGSGNLSPEELAVVGGQ